jgi:hypothetical protein
MAPTSEQAAEYKACYDAVCLMHHVPAECPAPGVLGAGPIYVVRPFSDELRQRVERLLQAWPVDRAWFDRIDAVLKRVDEFAGRHPDAKPELVLCVNGNAEVLPALRAHDPVGFLLEWMCWGFEPCPDVLPCLGEVMFMSIFQIFCVWQWEGGCDHDFRFVGKALGFEYTGAYEVLDAEAMHLCGRTSPSPGIIIRHGMATPFLQLVPSSGPTAVVPR